MKELSIFVDESGDLKILENELTNIGWPKHCVHAGSVIRSEEEYRGVELKERQKILMKMMAFRFSFMKYTLNVKIKLIS